MNALYVSYDGALDPLGRSQVVPYLEGLAARGWRFDLVTFEEKAQFEAYWYGPEFNHFRAMYSSYYQVPILYVWNDMIAQGELGEAPTAIVGAPTEGDTV